jgi:hypothetical protein
MNGVDNRKVLAHHLHFELTDRFQKGRRRYLIAIRSARRDNRKHACLPGFGNPSGGEGKDHLPATTRAIGSESLTLLVGLAVTERLQFRHLHDVALGL